MTLQQIHETEIFQQCLIQHRIRKSSSTDKVSVTKLRKMLDQVVNIP